MDYYSNNYIDYLAQNPPKKLRFYLKAIKENAYEMDSIFEIGFGKGLFLEYATKAGLKIEGCEINQNALDGVKLLFPKTIIHQGNFQDISGNIKKQQIIVAFDVVEHIKEVQTLFKSIYEKLENNGKFIFVCPVYDGPLGLLVKMLDRDPTHIHKKSRYWWLKQAKSAGFKIIDWKGIIRYLLPTNYYLHMEMRGFLRFFSSAIMVICSKP